MINGHTKYLMLLATLAACGGRADRDRPVVPPSDARCTYTSQEAGADATSCPHPDRTDFVVSCDHPVPASDLTPSTSCSFVPDGDAWCCEEAAPACGPDAVRASADASLRAGLTVPLPVPAECSGVVPGDGICSPGEPDVATDWLLWGWTLGQHYGSVRDCSGPPPADAVCGLSPREWRKGASYCGGQEVHYVALGLAVGAYGPYASCHEAVYTCQEPSLCGSESPSDSSTATAGDGSAWLFAGSRCCQDSVTQDVGGECAAPWPYLDTSWI